MTQLYGLVCGMAAVDRGNRGNQLLWLLALGWASPEPAVYAVALLFSPDPSTPSLVAVLPLCLSDDRRIRRRDGFMGCFWIIKSVGH